MKKEKIIKAEQKQLPSRQTSGGYAAQDFEQGRGGLQSGHNREDGEAFHQFENSGKGGFAAEHTANSNEVKK